MIKVIEEAVTSVLNQIAAAFPRLIGALVLLLVGWILAKLISGIVGRVLKRVGLDKLADKLNQTDAFKDANLTIRPVVIIQKFLYWMLMLIFILSATETLGLDILTEQIGALIQYIPKLLTAAIILGIGFYIANAVKDLVANATQSLGIPSWKFISSIVFYFLMLVIFVTSLNQAEIDTKIITDNVPVILGGILLAFAIAYGYAARPVLSSLLTSFYNKSGYEVGQIVEVDGHKGTIVEISNVSFILDKGDVHVVLPLSRLLSETVIVYKEKTS